MNLPAGRGVGHHRDTIGPEDLIEGGDELAVAVPDEDLWLELTVRNAPGQVAGLLRDPVAVGVIGAAGQVHPAGGQLDEEEDVEAAEQDGIDGEEVTSQNGAGVSKEEFAPRQASSTRGRRYALAPEHLADGGSREPVTQLAQLTLDPKVAPGGFSAASLRMRSRRSTGIGRRPTGPRRPKAAHFRRTSWRCQRTAVSGVTSSDLQAGRGS